ncbi:MAG TPA: SUMF1/EgtB/PvdO family nonheme iron enzyme [Kiritimatiellia bacterium]|nr:SUMF1/EgtB/PvdO family nonheme iron enzyme [Kiritimatiellia bacterium]HRU71422.1 SUMF1/EgtB/PvdO family nonheme iron enzyme [Kiritimatiellia bacterium]
MPLADVTLTAVIVPNLYPLTVENGSGSGSYTNGQIVTITANPTNTLLFEFTGWANAVNVAVAEPTNATTTVTMLGGDASVTATYGDKRYTLTVNFATGDGNYTNGQTVTIGATTTPPTAEHEFDHWEGDTATVADVNSAPTTFTMPATNVTLTAVFRPKLKPQNTFLTLDLSDNSVSYSDAPPAGGWTGLHKTTQMVFRKIPAGSFIMGSASGQANETPHSVTLTKDFYLGIFEVTQKQWEEIRGGTPPSYFSGDTLPVERVYYSDIRGNNLGKGWPANNQVDADSFMGRLRLKNAAVGAADLPTEAQWEYACRAGTTGDYAGPLDALAWYAANSTNRTQVVGSKQPNPWGLYDMHGNVWEICLDWYTATPGSAAQTDPPGTLPLRVKRGGAYNAPAAELRSAVRWNVIATNQLAGGGSITNLSIPNGFRVAVPQATASFALTVINGTVNTGGVFAAGTTIGLSPAPAPAGMKFGVWQVNPAGLDLGAGFVPSQAQPLLTMPASALTVEAIYIPEASAGLFRFVQNGPGGSVERWRAEGDGFTITAPAPEPGYKFSSWTVTPTGADLGAGFAATAATTTVLMPAMDVAVTPEYVLDVPDFTPETPTAGVAFMLDAGQGQRPATFSASGLPRGLRIDRETGVISGVPSKPGTYTVTVTAQRANGNSTSYTLAFTVQALDPALQGTFTGYCYEEEGGQCRIRGLVTFKATSLGRLTAKVVLQAVNLSFSAKSWSGVSGDSDYLAAMARRQGEQLDVTVDAATGFLTGTLSGGRVGAETLLVTAQRNAFLDRLNITAQTILAAYKGYYTVALPIEACETDPAIDNRQSGSGYVTITVRDRGAVKVAGKMADGTRVSLSSTLLVDDQGADVPLFVKLYGRRGIFAGLLHIGGGAYPATQRVGEVPDVRLEWLYPGSTMAGLADRFDAQLSALGAYYDAVGDLQAAYAGKILQAEGMEWAMPLAAGRSPGSLTVDPVIENPQAVKFKAARRTGLFSGSFRVMNEAGRNVTLKYVGVLTRLDDAYVGDGAYVEKRSANGRSVKSSYRVWIEAPHPQ